MPVIPARTRADRCPGVLRPWPADDGLLVRIRLVGGRLPADALRVLADVAARYGDGRIHTTSRANLQLRALPDDGTGHLPDEVEAAVRASGLVPSPEHDLVRNIMVSPLTGLTGGRADLRPIAAELDRRLLDSADLTRLPGKFLFVLDDGRGDVLGHDCDLGLVALDEGTVQLRVGDDHADVLPLGQAVDRLVELAERFVERRGDGPEAPWHVAEMAEPLVPTAPADPRLPESTGPLPFGPCGDRRHVDLGRDGIVGDALLALLGDGDELIVTPWYGVVTGVGA